MITIGEQKRFLLVEIAFEQVNFHTTCLNGQVISGSCVGPRMLFREVVIVFFNQMGLPFSQSLVLYMVLQIAYPPGPA